MKKLSTLLIAVLMLAASASWAQTETYEFVTQWGSLGSGNGQFGYDLGPRGLTVDNAGNLYVCDYGNQRIQAFNTSGTFQYSFYSGYGAGIAYSNGHLFFTRPAGSVCKYTTTGTQVWVRSYSAPGWTLNGICLDSDGNLHVCSGYYSKVYKIDANTGNLIKEYPVPGGPSYIAADNNGHVYIASGAGPILRYTNDGVYDNSRLDLPPAERAESITLDSEGHIFVGTLNHLMRKYDPNWNLLAEWGGDGSGPGKFTNPQGLAVDNQGFVYVSDGGGPSANPENRRIQVFRPSRGQLEVTAQATPKQLQSFGICSITACAKFEGVPVEDAQVMMYSEYGSRFIESAESMIQGRTDEFGCFSAKWSPDPLPFVVHIPMKRSVFVVVNFGQLTASCQLDILVAPGSQSNGEINFGHLECVPDYFAAWHEVAPNDAWKNGKEHCIIIPCELSEANILGQEICSEYLEYYSMGSSLACDLTRSGHIPDWHASSNNNDCCVLLNHEIMDIGSIIADRELSKDILHSFLMELTDNYDLLTSLNITLKGILAIYGYTQALAVDLFESCASALVRQQWGYSRLSYNEYQEITGTFEILLAVATFDQSKGIVSIESLNSFLKTAHGAVKVVSTDEGQITLTHGSKEIAAITLDFVKLAEILSQGNLAKSAPSGVETNNIQERNCLVFQNYPNPFNPTTEISFNLPEATNVKLEIYNVTGQKVATVVDGFVEAGEHTAIWDGSSSASGVYFYKLETGEFVETKKMMLLK